MTDPNSPASPLPPHLRRTHSSSCPPPPLPSMLGRSGSVDSISAAADEEHGYSPTPSSLKIDASRTRSGSGDYSNNGPPSPKDKDKRRDSSPGSPLKSEKKEGLTRRLSKLISRSPKVSTKSQPVSHYVTILKKKTVSKLDMISLQEDVRSQSQPWFQKFDDDAWALFESFLTQLGMKADKSDIDLEVQLEAIRAAAVMLNPTSRGNFSNSLKPAFLTSVAYSMSSSVKSVRYYVFEMLHEVVQLPKIGPGLVTEALNAYQKWKGDSSKYMPLVSGLVGDVGIDLRYVIVSIINTLLASVDDLEARFEIRNEIVGLGLLPMLQDMKTLKDDDLQIAVDTFEEASEDDYRVLVVRKKNIRSLVNSKKDSGYRPKNYFRVFLSSGHGITVSAVIPFVEGKTAQDIITTITNKHPVEDVSLYGLVVDTPTGSMWLEESKRVIEDYALGGEVQCEFKMKEWSVPVRSPDGVEELIKLDPYQTTSDVVSSLTHKFTLPATEEYGLYVSLANRDEKGFWLSENKQLQAFPELSKPDKVLELKVKPKALKVKFKDETFESVFVTPATLVEHVFQEIAGKMKVVNLSDYGICMEAGKERTWLEMSSPFSAYGLQDGMGVVRFLLRPSSVSVLLPDGSQKSVFAFLNHTVTEVIREICEQAKLDEATGYSLEKADGSAPLDDFKPLRDQNVTAVTKLKLVLDPKKAKDVTKGEDGGPNIWSDASEMIIINKEISCASLNKLVENLTSATDYDIDFMKTFLITYRSFTSTELFVKKLTERWNCPSSVDAKTSNVIRLRICTIIQNWLERLDEPQALDVIAPFVEKYILAESTLSLMGNKLKQVVENRRANPKSRVYTYQTQPPPVIPPKQITQTLTIWDIDEMELARQLTLPLFDLYSKIRPVELFNQAWNSPKLKHLSPNLIAVISYFNRIASWVAYALLQESALNNRAKLMKQFIMIADKMRVINNFHLLTAIISGLNNSAVLRLKWTHGKLPKHVQKIAQDLEDLTNMESSYKNFRRQLEHAVLPCIPYVGIYLMDLTFIEDGNPDLKGELINWDKRKLLFNIISQIQKFQLVGYNYTRDDRIQKFLDNIQPSPVSDRELYQKSLELEPRNAQRTDIR